MVQWPAMTGGRKGTVVADGLQALIFDVDGTLADTEREGHRVAFNRAFAAAGLDWDWSVDLYGELLAVTGGKERIRHYIDTRRPDFRLPERADEFIAALHRDKTALYTSMLAEGAIPLRSGVTRLLREARERGLRLAIATTTTPANVEALLTHALDRDAVTWFDVIAAGDIVARKKPGPDIYHLALDRLGLSASACLAFEDSHNGILSSTGAGLGTVITTNHYTKTHDFPGALLVIDRFGEPDDPMTVIAGDARGRCYVDTNLLAMLHTPA